MNAILLFGIVVVGFCLIAAVVEWWAWFRQEDQRSESNARPIR